MSKSRVIDTVTIFLFYRYATYIPYIVHEGCGVVRRFLLWKSVHLFDRQVSNMYCDIFSIKSGDIVVDA